jgi:hypothetical protein
MRNPLESTGFVICDDDNGRPHFIGTCFAYCVHGYLLTAAHNVRGIEPSRLSVSIYLEDIERGLDVRGIELHPEADLAILKIDDPIPDLRIFDPFQGIHTDYEAGEAVSAFGYPNQTMEKGQRPVPRFFRGNIQRMFRHDSPLGYKYIAIEVSFGSPVGLSGGPVSLDREPGHVVGVMAENYRADTYVHTIEEVVKGQSTYRDTQHDFINYGIAVRLQDHQVWIDDRCRKAGA